MKKILKNIFLFLTCIYCTAFIIFNTQFIGESVSQAFERCIYIIIPSLFAVMTFSGILIKSGIMGQGSVARIFVLSMLAGYPVGAGMISEEFERNSITKKQAELYISVCFGAGSSFIFGCVSDILFKGSSAGIIILVSTISVNFSALLLIMLTERKNRKKKPKIINNITFNSEMLVNSVLSGGRNIFKVCAMIMFFSVFSCILRGSGITILISEMLSEIFGINSATASAMTESILEVTNLGTLEKNNYTLLPFVCSAVSFGGICVILQIKTVINRNLSMIPFILIRTVCAVSSGLVCRMIMPFMLKGETISVSDIDYRIYSASTPIPSYMLIVMILILLCSIRNRGNRISHTV